MWSGSDEDNLKVVRQKCQSQNGGNKETKHAKFSNILGEEGRVRNICFSKNLARFAFLLHPFWDSYFCLITDKLRKCFETFSKTLLSGKVENLVKSCGKIGLNAIIYSARTQLFKLNPFMTEAVINGLVSIW